jgi:hypothetical protein
LTVLAAPQQPLDLSADRTRQVIVDREDGAYLGHVSTTLLRDGSTILAVYPKGHGKGAIVLKRSLDGGRTWSERLPTPANWATSQEVPTIHRCTDAEGKERLVLWSGLSPARYATSEDQGATFSELRPAADWGGIVVMGDIAATTTAGRYLAFFHDDGRFLHANGHANGTFTLLQTESIDGGLSWSHPRALWSGREIHMCEPGSVRSLDGKELTLLLRENRRVAASHRMTTRDEGATWTDPAPVHMSLTGDRHTMRYGKDGRLVVVFRDMRVDGDLSTRGDFIAWVGRYEDLRDGTPGQYRVRLLDNQNDWDCGYAGLEVLPDGTLVATTYGHWEKGQQPFVVSTRFTLVELDALAAAASAKGNTAAPVKESDAAALLRLEAYTPLPKAPTDPEVLAAEAQLIAAMPKLVRKNDAVAQRLAQLHATRRDEVTPTRTRPIRARDPLLRVLVRFDDELTLTTRQELVLAHPSAAEFPGGLPAGALPMPRGLTLDLGTPGRRSLGLWVPAGAAISVVFGDGKATPPLGLVLRIGAHSDDLRRREAWPRMPRISRTFAVDRADMRIASAYGGLLYVEQKDALPGGIDVMVDGCVLAPLFELGTTDVAAWREHVRRFPAPWAELATDKVVLTVPSDRIRELDDPTELLQFWNTLLDNAADLAARPRQRQRPERYVADVEISAGHMHAGYPIMTHLDAAADMVDLQRMHNGPWGLFHELGHNHQSKDWTFDGTSEVTVNLFSLYLCDTQCGIPWDKAWGGNLARCTQRLAELVRQGKKPWDPGDDGKADLGLRLLMYSQLQRAFGWELFVHAFAEYRDLPEQQRPKTDAEKRDQWLLRASRSVDRDLGPFFEAWGLPVSEQARAAVASLDDWMPEDWPDAGGR